MIEYAALINGEIQQIRSFTQAPENIPHKGIVWLPIVDTVDSFDDKYQILGNPVITIEETQVSRHIPAISLSKQEMIKKVIAERERRLALGFNYNFGDDRGIHQINTTEHDMKGWEEVTKAAMCFTALGMNTQTIDIKTETGPCVVTCIEWLQIIAYVTSLRQPIWTASFKLQDMNPIPIDYNSDYHWE